MKTPKLFSISVKMAPLLVTILVAHLSPSTLEARGTRDTGGGEPLASEFLRYGRNIESLLISKSIPEINEDGVLFRKELDKIQSSLDGADRRLHFVAGETVLCAGSPTIGCTDENRNIRIARKGYEKLSIAARHEVVALEIFVLMGVRDRYPKALKLADFNRGKFAIYLTKNIPAITASSPDFQSGFLMVQGEPGAGQNNEVFIRPCENQDCTRSRIVNMIQTKLNTPQELLAGRYYFEYDDIKSEVFEIVGAGAPTVYALTKVNLPALSVTLPFVSHMRVNYAKDPLSQVRLFKYHYDEGFDPVAHIRDSMYRITKSSQKANSMREICDLTDYELRAESRYTGTENIYLKGVIRYATPDISEFCAYIKARTDEQLLQDRSVVLLNGDGSVAIQYLYTEASGYHAIYIERKWHRHEEFIGAGIDSKFPVNQRFWSVLPGHYVITTTIQNQTRSVEVSF